MCYNLDGNIWHIGIWLLWVGGLDVGLETRHLVDVVILLKLELWSQMVLNFFDGLCGIEDDVMIECVLTML